MTRADSGVGRFATTRWSLVAALADQDQAVARASLVTLCLRYWYPVHAYLRRSGHEPAAARAGEVLEHHDDPPSTTATTARVVWPV